VTPSSSVTDTEIENSVALDRDLVVFEHCLCPLELPDDPSLTLEHVTREVSWMVCYRPFEFRFNVVERSIPRFEYRGRDTTHANWLIICNRPYPK